MAASATDKLIKISDGVDYPNTARVTSARSPAATTLSCDSLTGWDTSTGKTFVTYKLDTSDQLIAGSLTTYSGVVSGSTITNVTRIKGAADGGNAIGDVVQLIPDSEWADRLVAALLSSHNQNGSLKNGSISSSDMLASNVVSTAKLADGAVTPAKRTGGYYLGALDVTSTGTKTITAPGFQPKFLKITGVVTSNDVISANSQATFDGTNSYCMAVSSSGSAGYSRYYTGFAIINTTPAQIVNVNTFAFTSTGFTCNVATAAATVTVWYEAYA